MERSGAALMPAKGDKGQSTTDASDFHKFLGNVPVGAYRCTPDGRLVCLNGTLIDLLGASHEAEIEGTDIHRWRETPHWDWQEFRRRMGSYGQMQGLDTTWTRRDGSRLLARENVWTIHEDGKLLYYEGIVNDVTGRKLDEALRVFRLAFEAMPVGFYQADAAGRILQTNGSFQRLVGRGEDELDGASLRDLVHVEDRQQDERLLAELLSGQRDWYDAEKRYVRADGAILWAHETVSAVFDHLRRPQLVNAVIEDVTGRRLAEAELLRRTKELEGANRELEAFAYSISHDLRGPLRAIEGYASLIAMDPAASMRDESREFLSRIRSATGRMAQLIEDLLHLSRINRAEMSRQRFDFSQVAATVVDHLRLRDPDREIDAVIQPGVSAMADPKLIRVLLENLVGNAFKFTRNRENARIEVGSFSVSRRRVYYVRDNGAGFDMAHAARLFQPFQRLHTDREFEGSGIGLATVQRIIHRHGGRAWAEGKPDQGATVYFTLEPGEVIP